MSWFPKCGIVQHRYQKLHTIFNFTLFSPE